MRELSSVLIVILSICELAGQYIPDRELNWLVNERCESLTQDLPVYQKVEIDPAIHQHDPGSFRQSLHRMIGDAGFNGIDSVELKLVFLFVPNQPVCVQSIGFRGMDDNKPEQLVLLLQGDYSALKFSPGRQRDKEVICVGFLYLMIEKGEVTQFRNVNFQLD